MVKNISRLAPRYEYDLRGGVGWVRYRQEHFVVLSMDSGRRLINKRVVFIGTVDTGLLPIREKCMLAPYLILLWGLLWQDRF